MNTRRLEGRTALVTGSARGIGRAVAMALAREGARVAVNYRTRETEAKEVLEQIAAEGGDAMLVQADVSDGAEARGLVWRVLDVWNRLDILVNNAGITRDHSLRTLTDDDWREVLDTNLNSVFYCTTAAMPAMSQRFNITVNAVVPGFTLTDMLAKLPEDFQAALMARIPMRRFAEPEEVAKAVVFLVADGDYVTGQQLNVNGGIYM